MSTQTLYKNGLYVDSTGQSVVVENEQIEGCRIAIRRTRDGLEIEVLNGTATPSGTKIHVRAKQDEQD